MLNHRAVATVLVALAAAPTMAHGAPRGEAKATVAGKAVSIDYGRPSLANRDMLGKAEIGKPWRMGADAPTTLTTEADLTFGPAAVPKGTYVLTATKTAEGQWTLNVAKGDKTIATAPLTVAKLAESVETFTIGLHGEKDRGELELEWGTVSLKATFTGK